MPTWLVAPARKAGGFVLSWLFIHLEQEANAAEPAKCFFTHPSLSRKFGSAVQGTGKRTLASSCLARLSRHWSWVGALLTSRTVARQHVVQPASWISP